MVEWKEYITVENLTLIVAIATFIVTCLAYRYNRKSDKRRIRQELERKKAQLDEMNDGFFMMGVDHTVADKLRTDKWLLEAEIKQLKNDL